MRNKNIITIIIGFILFLVLIIFLSVWYKLANPTIKKINIEDGEVDRDIYENVVIEFNQNIGYEQTKMTIIESEDIPGTPKYSYFFNDRTLTLKIDPDIPFYPGTKYTLSVTPLSENGKYKGKKTVINFTTASLDESGKLPTALQEIATQKTNTFEDGGIKGLNFIGNLPIKKPSFTILYANQIAKKDGSFSVDLYVKYLSVNGASDLNKYLVLQGADFKNIKIIESSE